MGLNYKSNKLSIRLVTYWLCLVLNAYEERCNTSKRGTVDLRLHTYQDKFGGLRVYLAVKEKSKAVGTAQV